MDSYNQEQQDWVKAELAAHGYVECPALTTAAARRRCRGRCAVHRSDGSVCRLLSYLGDLHMSSASILSMSPSTPTAGLWVQCILPTLPATTGSTAAENLPIVVYFHGDGFVVFSVVPRSAAVVVSVNYRLAPEHKFLIAYVMSVSCISSNPVQHPPTRHMAGADVTRRRSPPSLPWKVRLQFAALSAAHRSDGSIRRLFCYLGDLHSAASPRPDAAGVRSVDVTIDSDRRLWARVFSPPAKTGSTAESKLPVVVYFHGGGFVLFSAASRPYDALCRRICREVNAVVVSVNYRLSPEHKFPAAYDDGEAVLRYLAVTGLPADVTADLTRVFLAGDSAGGNIAHHVATRWSSSSPSPSLRLAGVVLIQPFFGGEERTEEEIELDTASPSLTLARTDYYWREFLPDGATRDHEAARVVASDAGDVAAAEGFPPAMVVIGGFDLLKGWQARYAAALRREGKTVRVVEFSDAIHGFYALPELADSGKLMEEMKVFVQEHSSKLMG
uniref:Alpha/beta hydrolase fold-3 domain-containing protein n=1 Tax=Leersia perrieri TaxID=77586 RepID=A0A0D9X246_9ORYZ